MLKEFVHTLLALAPPTEVRVDQRPLFDRALHVPPKLIPERVECSTLSALAVLAMKLHRAGSGGAEDPCNIVEGVFVEDPTNVVVKSMADAYGRRGELVRCTALVPRIVLNEYITLEDMRLQIMSRFQDSDDAKYSVELMSRVVAEEIREDSDNKAAQQVVARKGIATLGREDVRPIVNLRPIRSFPELQQVAAPFLLRFKTQGADKSVLVGLFEADGGAWKVDAIRKVGEQLLALGLAAPGQVAPAPTVYA